MTDSRTQRKVAIAVGPHAVSGARLASSKRSWNLRVVSTWCEASALVRKEPWDVCCVVGGGPDLSPRVLLELSRTAAEHCPSTTLGFLYGRSEQELQAAAARLPRVPAIACGRGPHPVFKSVDWHPDLIGAATLDARATVHSPSEYAALLAKPSELTFLLGHSNGIDMSVGDAVVCTKGQSHAEPSQLGVLPCFHDGVCTRTLSGAVRANISSLGAKRAIIVSCWGVLIGDHPYVSESTLGHAILEDVGVEALVTTVRAATIADPDLALLYFLAQSGVPFGAISNRVNRFRLHGNRSVEFLCFGDPETRLDGETRPLRISSNAELVELTSDGERELIDVEWRLPAGDPPADPVVVIEGGEAEVLAGALEPCGRAFATLRIPSGRFQGRMSLLDRSELLDPGNGPSALLRDLRFLEIYLPHLDVAEPHQRPLAKALEDLSHLRDVLLAWPLSSVSTGQVVDARLPEGLASILWDRLQRLLDGLIQFYSGFLAERGGLHLGNWAPLYRLERTDEAVTECEYCGHMVHELVMIERLAAGTRCIGSCDLCGIIYDGDPEVGRWVDAPATIAVGRALDVGLRLASPYGTEVPGCAVAVLERFELGQSLTGASTQYSFPKRAVGTIHLRMDIPSSLPPGTYYLAASAILGTRVQFYRRTIRLARASN